MRSRNAGNRIGKNVEAVKQILTKPALGRR